MFKNQPKGLFALALANTGERFGYYTMIAVFALFLRANFGLSAGTAGTIYSSFLMLVYFFPLIGGILADKFGFGKMVTTGILVMFLGYLLLSIPLGSGTVALVAMLAALILIGFGTGLFKGNLQVMVGDLYNDPEYAAKRDSGFSLFYMAINIGALFAPTAAIKIREWAISLGFDGNSAYHFSFAVACVSLIVSIAIYYAFRSWFKHVEGGHAKGNKAQVVDTLTPEQTKKRMVALFLVFAVVIFFWMSFHQNGLTLTYFADEFTERSASGLASMPFNVWNLVAVIAIVYALFSIFDKEATNKGKWIGVCVVGLACAYLVWQYNRLSGSIAISAPIFQHFNPFYVVALTPVSMAIFDSLAKRKKEPSAPVKIGLGMFVAAIGYLVMIVASRGQASPAELAGTVSPDPVVPTYLMGTYLILTFAELLLSPMGISFVTKVAPPRLKGLMMGLWFASTAIGNYLSSIPGLLWERVPLWANWAILMALCVVAGVIMFAMLKKINAATAE